MNVIGKSFTLGRIQSSCATTFWEEDQVSDNLPPLQYLDVVRDTAQENMSRDPMESASSLGPRETSALAAIGPDSSLAVSELALVRRAAAGDAGAAHSLVDRYAQKLFGLAVRLTGNATDAEDVLQETFTGALKGFGSFEGRSSVKTWMTRILVTQVARWRRSERVRQTRRLQTDGGETTDPAVMSSDHAVSSGQRLDLNAAIAKLSPEHREVIVLREYDGLSYDEISQVLRVPRGTVESRLHRARGELRERLKDYRP